MSKDQIHIEIFSPKITIREGVSQKTGKPYKLFEQFGYVHKVDEPYPEQIKFTVDNQACAYPVGLYKINPDSYFVDVYKNLSIRLSLIPLAAEAQKRSA